MRCQAIASPSRSGSVARYTSRAFCTYSLSSLMIFDLSRGTRYVGAKSSSTSTPNVLFGKSRTCPIEARTVYPDPRYLPIVRAFAGDSTMTSLPRPALVVARAAPARLALVVLVVLLAARRGLALICSGIVIESLRTLGGMKKRERNALPGGDKAENGAEP